MTATIKNEFGKAIQRWINDEDYLPMIGIEQDPLEQLKANIIKARARMHNEVLLQLAITGRIEQNKRTSRILNKDDRKVAIFLAKALGNDFAIIYHLENISPRRIRRNTSSELDIIAREVKKELQDRKKNPSSFETDRDWLEIFGTNISTQGDNDAGASKSTLLDLEEPNQAAESIDLTEWLREPNGPAAKRPMEPNGPAAKRPMEPNGPAEYSSSQMATRANWPDHEEDDDGADYDDSYYQWD